MNTKLFAALSAAVLVSAVSAQAATLTNTDKETRNVQVTVDGKTSEEKIEAGKEFSTGDKAATFQIGKEKAVKAKADKDYVIKHNTIKAEKKTAMKDTDATKASETAPAAGNSETGSTLETPSHDMAPSDTKSHPAEQTTPAQDAPGKAQ